MVRHVGNAVRAFDSFTSCQAEHEKISLKVPGGGQTTAEYSSVYSGNGEQA
jgi:hypothetical protein